MFFLRKAMHRTSLQETRKEQVFSLRGREGDATFSSIANSGRIANGLKGPVQIITECSVPWA